MDAPLRSSDSGTKYTSRSAALSGRSIFFIGTKKFCFDGQPSLVHSLNPEDFEVGSPPRYEEVTRCPSEYERELRNAQPTFMLSEVDLDAM
jgi:hypothetical protein